MCVHWRGGASRHVPDIQQRGGRPKITKARMRDPHLLDLGFRPGSLGLLRLLLALESLPEALCAYLFASHRIALHRIVPHRIASHCIASYHIAKATPIFRRQSGETREDTVALLICKSTTSSKKGSPKRGGEGRGGEGRGGIPGTKQPRNHEKNNSKTKRMQHTHLTTLQTAPPAAFARLAPPQPPPMYLYMYMKTTHLLLTLLGHLLNVEDVLADGDALGRGRLQPQHVPEVGEGLAVLLRLREKRQRNDRETDRRQGRKTPNGKKEERDDRSRTVQYGRKEERKASSEETVTV